MRVVSFFHVGEVPFYAHMMVRSAKAILGWPIVQMTDEDSEEIPGVDEVIRRPYYGLLSKARIDHIRDYPHEEMLCLDTDTIVKRDVAHVFEQDFDVALTKRTRPVRSESGFDITRIYPYNCGVMFSRSRKFWEDCSQFLEDDVGVEFSEWMGEQLSMNVVAESGKHRVLDLRVEEYNFTPAEKDETSDAYIWHYKGGRKSWLTK